MGRKTCPTHRGLRRRPRLPKTRCGLSEDLPHSSGIKTVCQVLFSAVCCRKTCPTHRGLRRMALEMMIADCRRKTCPTHRGLRPRYHSGYVSRFRRKTCPTHRGLRRKLFHIYRDCRTSEDLPHSSGIKTNARSP